MLLFKTTIEWRGLMLLFKTTNEWRGLMLLFKTTIEWRGLMLLFKTTIEWRGLMLLFKTTMEWRGLMLLSKPQLERKTHILPPYHRSEKGLMISFHIGGWLDRILSYSYTTSLLEQRTGLFNIAPTWANVFCFLSSLPLLPQLPRLCLTPGYLSSLYSWQTLYLGCGLAYAYPYDWRGFVGAKKKTSLGLWLYIIPLPIVLFCTHIPKLREKKRRRVRSRNITVSENLPNVKITTFRESWFMKRLIIPVFHQ